MKMKRTEKIKREFINFLYDHYPIKELLSHLKYLFLSLFGAFLYSFGFTSFIIPHLNNFQIATGGVSGLTQIVALIFSLFGKELPNNVIQSIGYTVFNLPLLIFAFIKIGKKFSMYTTINVLATSIFIVIFSVDGGIAEKMGTACIINSADGTTTYLLDSMIVRVLFAGLCSGLSCGLSFIGDFSSGGVDIVTYYLGMKKSTQIGKYGVLINIFIVSTFSLLTILDNPGKLWANGLISLLYSGFYLFVVALVIDFINLRNKKTEVKIITKAENMANILIANFPHGATLSNAQGAYSKNDEYIVWMIVSINEYKKVVNVAKKVDPNAFISVCTLVQVYGNFYSKPIE